MESIRRLAALSLAALTQLALAAGVEALDPSKAITQYGHDTWQIEQGLPNGTVTAITQTRDGYLWLGTNEGLVRFDGLGFTVFDKANTPAMRRDLITALHEDRQGTLWIGTAGGLVRRRSGRFDAYAPRPGMEPDDAGQHVRAIAETPQGALWVAWGAHGLYQLVDEGMVVPAVLQKAPPRFVTALHADDAGALWIGTRQGLVVFSNGSLRSYGAAQGLASNDVRALAAAPDGDLWIGTAKGLSRLRSDGQFTNQLGDEPINKVLQDRDGALWMGTSEHGLLRWHAGQLQRYAKPQGLSGINVDALWEDREGSLWVGVSDGGLDRLRDGAFTPIGEPEGLSENVTIALHATADGSVWVGTSGGGLNHIQDGRISTCTTRDGLSQDRIPAVGSDTAGAIWVGAYSGLSRWQDGKAKVYRTGQGLSHDSVFSVLGSRDGSLWVGTRGGGLNHLLGERFVTYGAGQGLLSPFIWDLLEDDAGTLWIGTGGGVYTLSRQGQLRKATPEETPARRLHLDSNGVLWAGSSRGLYRWKDGQGTTFTTREGLVNDHVTQILEDERQQLWLGSNRGISRVSKQELADVAAGRRARVTPTSYDTSDGLRSRECNFGSGCKTRDGRLWFPTIRGVVVVDPQHLKANPLPPPVHVERVVADGHEFDLPDNGPLQVPPGQGRLEFHFAALSYLAPAKVRCSYRLEGFDSHWSVPSSHRDATYTNLRPGHYTFRVKAANNDGVWNETGAAVALHLRPHFYQTRWFYALCTALVAGAAYRIHLLRVQRLVELERVRTRIAADLHDDIGAGLSQIAVLSEVVRQQPESARARDSLSRIAATAGELVDSMSDIVWVINPGKDRLSDLVQRMRHFANDVEHARGVEVELRIAVKDAGQKLGPDLRRHVYLVFKEAVSNAVRHSGCARVDVALDQQLGTLRLGIEDDGRGFDPNQPRNGHGLQTMVRRAAELGGRTEIVAREGQGTVVRLEVPLGRASGRRTPT